ncbi:hypothetical protein GCM10022255_093100 [Dactylosporangium darangshiense]|uniref:Uncharacterized protein n=2 Tax=Dactylosporangium darangshiense TaxID=579108 RepID=A0ABP8DQC6_9ACTN
MAGRQQLRHSKLRVRHGQPALNAANMDSLQCMQLPLSTVRSQAFLAGATFDGVKAADLARRFRTYDGWLPPAVANRLAEHGHLDELRRLAERGDWCCADRLTRTLFERHEPEAAMQVLRPFVETGWWQAVEVLVDFHDRRGETDAAIALARGALDKGSPHGIERLAVLLARRGRVDEAVVLLRPYAGEHVVLTALIELTEGHGYDGDLTALVRKQIEADSP